MSRCSCEAPQRLVDITVDGETVRVPEGATLLEACRQQGIDTPTLCYLENLTPVNVCRVCVVEVEGSRTLVPACSRKAEPGMVVHTDSERVRTSRQDGAGVPGVLGRRVARRARRAPLDGAATAPTRPGTARRPRRTRPGSGTRPGPASTTRAEDSAAETVAQPVKYDNDSYVRDYSRCILCYKCVEACGDDAQNTFAIAVAGRGFDARISTEFDVGLPDSACVYCGNCIGVCPTGALMFESEYKHAPGRHLGRVEAGGDHHHLPVLRRRLQPRTARPGQPDRQGDLAARPRRQHGHLCVKGRFGFEFVQRRARES